MRLSADRQQKLVEDHLPLAKSLAGRYRKQGVAFEDLYQEACLGLVEAARTFDVSETPIEHFGEYGRCRALGRIINAIDANLEQRTQVTLPALPAPEPDPHSERAAEELWSAAEILSSDDRELLADRYGLDGRAAQGIHELSSRRDISCATLKRRLDEIRKRLKLELIKRGWKAGGNSPPAAMQLQFNIG